MIRSMIMLSLTLPLILAPAAPAQPAKKGAPLRLALVTASVSAKMNNLLDLAEANLSAEDGFVLLDRKAVAKIFAEQKLSLAGLVDSNFAVRSGKLLSVNAFAIVEADPLGKEALGLVIYDVDTGVKWHDATLASGTLDQQVDAIEHAVHSVAKKRAAGPKSWQTVCVLGTRNADLPRTQDHVAATVSWLLERHLLASPSLAVLERKRLDLVTQEKALTGTHKDLLASLVTVDVEISRADKGIQATAFLSDTKGKDLGKVRAESPSSSAEELANDLLAGIARALKAAPAPAAPDRLRESQRFAQEGRRLSSHNQWESAIPALETAYALDPDNAAIRNDLAKGLVVLGQTILSPGPDARGKLTPKAFNLPTDLIKKGLSAGARGYDLRLAALQKLPATHKDLLPHDVFFRAADLRLPPFSLPGIPKESIDEECRQLRRAVFDAHTRMASAELEHWAKAVAAAQASPVQLNQAFRRYVLRLTSFLGEVRRTGFYTEQEVDTITLKWLEDWSNVSRTPTVSVHPYDVNGLFKESSDRSLRPVPFYESLAKHPDPLAQLWGRYLLLAVKHQHKQIAGPAAQQAYQEIKRSALQTIAQYKPPAVPFLSVHDDLRHGCYEFLMHTSKRWPFVSEEERFRESAAVCDFMLGRKELVTTLLLQTLKQEPPIKSHHHAERLKLIDEAQTLLESTQARGGTPSLCELVPYLKSTLVEVQQAILRERPELAQGGKNQAGPTLWMESRRLLRRDEIPGLIQMGQPVVQGDHILLPITRGENAKQPYLGTVWLEVLKISWKDKGKPEKWAQWKLPARKFGEPLPHWVLRCACWGDGRCYLGTTYGILAVDKDGSIQHLNQASEFPAIDTVALAYQQGTLFAVLDGGYILALDPRTNKYETLASSQRRERLSPFDDGDKFRVYGLLADEPRDRLMMLVEQRANKPEDFRKDGFPKDNMNGLWEYNLKTRQFKRHLVLYTDRFNTASALEPGRWLLAHKGNDNVLDFDLKSNQAHILLGLGVPGPDLHKFGVPRQKPAFPFYKYCWHRDGYLWAMDAQSLARVSLKDGRAEGIPGFAPESTTITFCWFGMARISPTHVLVQNRGGLWALEMPAQ